MKMKIMCDTNVIIDVLLEREPFVEASYMVLSLCEEHRIEGFVSASSVTDIYYLVRKYTHSTELAYKAVGKLLEIEVTKKAHPHNDRYAHNENFIFILFH